MPLIIAHICTRINKTQSILAGNIYGPLQDKKFFNQVEIDPEVHKLVWPNGADFDPATLYDWPEYVQDLKMMAELG